MQAAHTFEREGDRLTRPAREQGFAAVRNGVRHFRWEGAVKIEVPTQDVVATGAPLEPGRAGREAVREFGEALDRLAD